MKYSFLILSITLSSMTGAFAGTCELISKSGHVTSHSGKFAARSLKKCAIEALKTNLESNWAYTKLIYTEESKTQKLEILNDIQE